MGAGGGLGRVLLVYQLLERTRAAECMAGAAALQEVERALAEVDADAAAARAGEVADGAEGRAIAQQCLDAGQVRGGRLRVLHRERTEANEGFLARLTESRVEVRQVEELVDAERSARELETCRRTQLAADDRFLALRMARARER